MKLSDIYDFKKHASSVLKQQDAEVAFMRASTNIIEDKAAPLMKDPFYLGFEIVKTNDAFTKMIGIYIFRINKKFLYAPVFYVDGKIKGTDLLYVCDEKLFVTLTPEWCEYLLGKYETEIGSEIDSSLTNDANQHIDLQWLAYPSQGFGKHASVKYDGKNSPLTAFDFIKEASGDFDKDTADSLVKFFEDKDPENYRPLYHFIKSAGYDAFDKLAHIIKNDFDFANNIVGLCDESDYIPNDVIQAEHEKNVKLAKEKFVDLKKPLLTVYSGEFNKEALKYASAEDQIEKGYTIVDNRDEAKKSELIEDPENFRVRIMDESVEYSGVTKPLGIYNMLDINGNIIKCCIIRGFAEENHSPALIISLDKNNEGLLEGKISTQSEEIPPYFHRNISPDLDKLILSDITEENKDELDNLLKVLPEPKKAYAIWVENANYLSDEAFYVDDVVDNKDGSYSIKTYTFFDYNFLPSKALSREDRNLIININPNVKFPLYDLHVFPASTRWIELPLKRNKDIDELKDNIKQDTSIKDLVSTSNDYNLQIKQLDIVPGTWETLNDNLNTNLSIKHASVLYFPFLRSFELDIMGEKQLNLNKMAALSSLMINTGINESDAMKALDESQKRGKYAFFHRKIADRIILNPTPDFFEAWDGDLNLKTEFPQTRVLITEGDYSVPPSPRYGDEMPVFMSEATNNIQPDSIADNSGVNNSLLDVADAETLAALARSTGRKSLFEHGVVGALSRISDANNFIDEFLPDMRRGLDKFGRLLFLIIIRPQDFIKNYGADEIENLENSVLSVFKQTGELVLTLLKKSSNISINATDKE